MIKIIKYVPHPKGSLEGFVSIEIPLWKMTIHDIGIFRKENQRWIGFPSRSYEVEGVRKYMPYISLDPEYKARLEKSIFAELATYKPKDLPLPALPQQGQGTYSSHNETLPF